MHKPELLAPADNFTLEELKEGVEYAHLRGKKIHTTLNIIPHNEDMRKENGEVIESAASARMIFMVRCVEELKTNDIIIKSNGTLH